MTQFKFNVGSPAQAYIGGLTWNSNGSLGQLAITDPFNSADTQTCNYSHDDLSRIAKGDCGTVWGQNFSYDPFGNIQKAAITGEGGTTFAPCYQSSPSITNRISLVGGTGSNCTGGTAPSYDANGNSTNDTFRTFTWDSDANPVTIGSVSLTYDALDRMVEQSVSGTNSEIVYGPGGGKLALMNGGTLTKAFVPLTGGATAVYTSSGLAYYRHSDHLGSSRLSTTATQTQTPYSDIAYSPFGEPYAGTGAIDNSFTGQNQDTNAGLYDFLFREQDPNQGRWNQPDPAGLAAVNPANPQSWNRYAYVLNNPLAVFDPLGLDCVYLNDSGDGVEWIDTNSTADECGASGGTWFGGTVDAGSIQTDPNSDWVFASGTVGNSQFSCGGPNCDPGSLDGFANSIFGQSSTQVNANPGSFLSFIFSPTVPIYVPNDVPLNQNARIILPLAAAETTHALGCVGIGGLVAGGSVAASAPIIPKPFSAGGTSGTSVASTVLRGVNTGVSVPTPVGVPGTSSFAWRASADLGAVASRWLPYVGTAYGVYKLNQCLSSKP